jgi:hypothetical protein
MRTVIDNIFFILVILLTGCNKHNPWNMETLPKLGNVQLVGEDLQGIRVRVDFETDGYTDIEGRGFCWSYEHTEPNIEDDNVLLGPGNESFSVTIQRDSAATLYIRAFTNNEVGWNYSPSLAVVWNGNDDWLPVVSLSTPQDVGFFDVRAQGEIVSNGGLAILERGFCFSAVNSEPTKDDSFVMVDADFEQVVSSLSDNTTYYLRAYARNLQGIAYSNTEVFQTRNYFYPGETGPAGGYIFFSKVDTLGGWNFMEAAATDINGLYAWAPQNEITTITATGLGEGQLNTGLIVGLYGNTVTYAAAVCADYTFGGFNDWYLPSRDELNRVYQNLYMQGIGALMNESYWTSSEDTNFENNAWIVKMIASGSSNILSFNKQAALRVRPVRRF